MNRKQRRSAAKLGQTPSNPSGETAVAALLMEGVRYHQAGRLSSAEDCYRQILAAQPDHPEALHLLGVIAHQVGQPDVALELIGQAIKRDGQNPVYSFNLGNVFAEQGKLDEAIAAFRRAVRAKPDYAEAHLNIGIGVAHQGKLDEAIAAYRRAIDSRPDYAEAHCNLGKALQHLGKFDEALAAYRQAIASKPAFPEAHYNLGSALESLGEFDAAATSFRRAIDIKADFAEPFFGLGNALSNQGRLGEAASAYRSAIDIKPDYAEALFGLGNILTNQGEFDAAITAYREAIRIRPNFAEAHSSLLGCLNYYDKMSADQLFAEHQEWGRRFGPQPIQPIAHVNDRTAERRLRIGYVSPDFRLHSVAYFVEPLLRGHDRRAVEVFCYAEVLQPDVLTVRLKDLADHWLVTAGMSDDALDERIRADGIDILVDLAGHTTKNRLGTFARKPAPVQVTWLGYPNTTGLDAIDYRLVDAVTDPDGEADARASETLVRLENGFHCYGGLPDASEPTAPPSLKCGSLTFGSFNNPAKMSTATFDAWATLLARRPDARLLLKGSQFGDAATRALFLGRLGERGVAAERVDLVASLPDLSDHLSVYDRVDITLDPFPYNGTTTTCEALWMGVPVVTLRGDRHAGRVGASLLSQIGLTDLIANSVEEYVEIALALAGNPDRLGALRQSLRPRLGASSLCDDRAFAGKIEASFRQMWQRWCEPALVP
jgi:protein O-GlcNAc transferase